MIIRNLVVGLVFLGAALPVAAQEFRLAPAVFPAEPEPEPAPFVPEPLLGLHGGFLKMQDADDAEPYVGAHLRLPVAPIFVLEFAVDLQSAEFADGDAEISQVPVLASLYLLFDLEYPTVKPYLVGGLGLYFTQVDFSGDLSGLDDDDSAQFGAHIGAGLQVDFAGPLLLHTDVRYVYQSVESDDLEDEEMDATMFTVGLSFGL